MKQQLQYHARVLQSRVNAVTAILMTFFLLCIEQVRAFTNQYHITSHDAMVLASAASSLSRKLSTSVISSSDNFIKKTQSYSFLSRSATSMTQLNAWSIPAIVMPNMPTFPTSKDIPIHHLGSWYTKVDPTTKPPVYNDDEYSSYDNTYGSFFSSGSPTDDWPTVDEDTAKAVQSHMRLGPLKTIRRVAGRFKDSILAQ